jgi:hypothetical protein
MHVYRAYTRGELENGAFIHVLTNMEVEQRCSS